MVQRLRAALPASWLPAGKHDSNLMAVPTSVTPVWLLNCTTHKQEVHVAFKARQVTHSFGRLFQGTMPLLGDSQSLLYQQSPRHHLDHAMVGVVYSGSKFSKFKVQEGLG